MQFVADRARRLRRTTSLIWAASLNPVSDKVPSSDVRKGNATVRIDHSIRLPYDRFLTTKIVAAQTTVSCAANDLSSDLVDHIGHRLWRGEVELVVARVPSIDILIETTSGCQPIININ